MGARDKKPARPEAWKNAKQNSQPEFIRELGYEVGGRTQQHGNPSCYNGPRQEQDGELRQHVLRSLSLYLGTLQCPLTSTFVGLRAKVRAVPAV